MLLLKRIVILYREWTISWIIWMGIPGLPLLILRVARIGICPEDREKKQFFIGSGL